MAASSMFPRRSSAPVPPNVSAPSAEPVWPLDILVVDDDDVTLDMLVRVLRSLGHSCRQATSAGAAISLLREKPSDVVLCDWEMPGMTGLQLCRHIRQESSSSSSASRYTYFILVTGMDEGRRQIEAMEAGIDEFMGKPVDLDVLEARLILASRVVGMHRKFEKQADRLRRDSRRLYRASHTDTLTGVGSRLAFEEELDAALSRKDRYGRGASLAICDVDLFKQYNDHYGHVAGDEALRRIGQTLKDHLRASDHVYRYGGEEFVVLLPEQGLEEASSVIDRLREKVAHLTMPAPTQSGILTISAGVAQIEEDDTTRSHWLERADQALYRAKLLGRNRVERATDPPDEPA